MHFSFQLTNLQNLQYFFKNGISMNETLQSVKLNMQFILMTTNFISKIQNMAPLLVKNQDDKRTFIEMFQRFCIFLAFLFPRLPQPIHLHKF
jgi:hypothetical protein